MGPKFCRAPFLTNPSSLCHKCSKCGIGLHVFCYGRDQEGGVKLCAQCTYPQGVSNAALLPPNALIVRGEGAAGPIYTNATPPHADTLESPIHIGDDDDDNNNKKQSVIVDSVVFNGRTHNIDVSKASTSNADDKNKKEKRCAYSCRSKCLVRSKEASAQVMFLCYTAGCRKETHAICSLRMVHESKGGIFFFENSCDTTPEVTVLHCRKECYNKYKRGIEEQEKEMYKKANSGWTDDGKNGNGVTSMDVLIKWLTDDRNCDRYFGSHVSSNKSNIAEKAVTKNDLCKEIVEIIEQEVGAYPI